MTIGKKNKLIIFLIFLGIIIVLSGKYFYFTKQKEKPELPEVEINYLEIPFEIIESSYYNEHKEKQNYVIKNSSEWATLWSKIHTVPDQTPPPSPRIDFSKYNIIAVFMGMRSSGGYSIEISKIEKTDSNTRIIIREVVPGRNCMVTQAITFPNHIVKVPLLDSSSHVEFITNKQTRNCE